MQYGSFKEISALGMPQNICGGSSVIGYRHVSFVRSRIEQRKRPAMVVAGMAPVGVLGATTG